MSSDAELDAKLEAVLRLMVSRLPENKRLPTAVVQQLLRSKYAETYPEAYVASHETFITETVNRLMREKQSAAAPSAAAKDASSSESESDDDSDDDEEDEEGDEGDEEEDDEEEDESDEEEDEEDDEEEEEPEKKKARLEEEALFAKKEGGDAADGVVSTGDRCKAMVDCLRKLKYRVRPPTEEETLDDYLLKYLIPEFEKRNMDPEKYSAKDLKRYRTQREVELLQQDGASMNLDRRSRVGRGYSNVVMAGEKSEEAQAPLRKTSIFLDDE